MTKYNYVTLDAYKIYAGIPLTQTGMDADLTQKLAAMSRTIERESRRKFYPVLETRYFDMGSDSINLWLNADLLSVSEVLTGNGTVTLTPYASGSGDYHLMPYNGPPYDRIFIDADSSSYWQYVTSPNQAHSITGLWGWHDDFSYAWEAETTLAEAITDAAATTIKVSSAADIKAGALVRVGSEYMLVRSVDESPTPDEMVVRRGYHGSTAATHSNGASVDLYSPPQSVVDAVYGLLDWQRTGEPGGTTQNMGETPITGRGERYPEHVYRIMMKLKRVRVT